ncbi:unnamed protein product [Ambrosiozyma monospora]|uniref:Unnamed protein product n=1 Tax=Ambrosiozyma monospora TaxID=43982 RepID=A0A9W6TAD8_AMBMO|nr:unnamed protein product [Ambrosiozyma monospora]
MALEELDLKLKLKNFDDPPFIDEFINFVTSRSVQLKSVKLCVYNDESTKQFTKPNTMKLLEFHSDQVILNSCGIGDGFPKHSLKFVTSLFWEGKYLARLLDPDVLNSLTSLSKLTITLYAVEDLSKVDGIMEHLQLAVPSMKHLYLDFQDHSQSREIVDFLVQANTFIRKHKNLYIHFEVLFLRIDIESHWVFDSKTQLSLPLHTPYPTYINEIGRIEQWCSVSGLTGFRAFNYDSYEISTLFLTNTEMIPFIRAINSTVSSVQLSCFSAEYEIVLDGFRSLKQLSIRFSVLNKFPRLPESLRELEIECVNDLTVSDIEHGIILPTRLCSLIWLSKLACFTLPKILNIDKLPYLKDVSVEISPFLYVFKAAEEEYDMEEYLVEGFNGEGYCAKDYVTRDFVRLTNTCTAIDQLQQFVSQLPSELEILKINIEGCLRPNLDYHSACCPDKLSFKRFTNLDYLEWNKIT